MQPHIDRVAAAVAVEHLAHQTQMDAAHHLRVGAGQIAQRAGGEADQHLLVGLGGRVAFGGEAQFRGRGDSDVPGVGERGDGLVAGLQLGAPGPPGGDGRVRAPPRIATELIGQHLGKILIADRSLDRGITDARAAATARRLLELPHQRLPRQHIEMESDGGDVLPGYSCELLGIERLAGAT